MDSLGVQLSELHAAYRFSLEKPDTAAPRKSTKPTKPSDADVAAALGE